jgi:hypothetical protein
MVAVMVSAAVKLRSRAADLPPLGPGSKNLVPIAVVAFEAGMVKKPLDE